MVNISGYGKKVTAGQKARQASPSRFFRGMACGVLAAALALGLVMAPGTSFAKKQIELSFALYTPPKASPYAHALLPWAKELEKRTNGKVKVTFYLSQTLVKARDSYDAVVKGIADLSWAPISLTPGRFPLTGVMELPFMSPNTFVGAHSLLDLYKKYPQMQAEYKDVHILGLWVSLPYEVHTSSKPIKTIEDIKGVKFATVPAALMALDGLGAVPVTMAIPKIYQTVEKGVTDGATLAWGAYDAYKLYEVTQYHTKAHLGGVCYWMAINKKTWKSLPEDVRKVMTELSGANIADALSKAVTAQMNKGIKVSLERGQKIYDLSAEERAKWTATAKPAWDKWVKDMEAKGYPGKAMLDDALSLVKQYSPKYQD